MLPVCSVLRAMHEASCVSGSAWEGTGDGLLHVEDADTTPVIQWESTMVTTGKHVEDPQPIVNAGRGRAAAQGGGGCMKGYSACHQC